MFPQQSGMAIRETHYSISVNLVWCVQSRTLGRNGPGKDFQADYLLGDRDITVTELIKIYSKIMNLPIILWNSSQNQ